MQDLVTVRKKSAISAISVIIYIKKEEINFTLRGREFLLKHSYFVSSLDLCNFVIYLATTSDE